MLCPAKLSFKIDVEISIFQDKHQVKTIHNNQANIPASSERNSLLGGGRNTASRQTHQRAHQERNKQMKKKARKVSIMSNSKTVNPQD